VTTQKELFNLCNDIRKYENLSEHKNFRKIKNFQIFQGDCFDSKVYTAHKSAKLRLGCWKKSIKAKHWPVLSHPENIDKYVLCNIVDDAYEYIYGDTYGSVDYYTNYKTKKIKKHGATKTIKKIKEKQEKNKTQEEYEVEITDEPLEINK
jgi:hypothetical protein